MPERWICRWTATLLKLVCDLEKRNIFHRDISLANCFLHRSTLHENPELILGDFGISKTLQDRELYDHWVDEFFWNLRDSLSVMRMLIEDSTDPNGYMEKYLSKLAQDLQLTVAKSTADKTTTTAMLHTQASLAVSELEEYVKQSPEPTGLHEIMLATDGSPECNFRPYTTVAHANAHSVLQFQSTAQVEKRGEDYHITEVRPQNPSVQLNTGNWAPALVPGSASTDFQQVSEMNVPS